MDSIQALVGLGLFLLWSVFVFWRGVVFGKDPAKLASAEKKIADLEAKIDAARTLGK